MPETAESFAVEFSINGEQYRCEFAAITARHERELWAAARLTPAGIGDAIEAGDHGLFMIAALAFLARRQAGDDKVTYAAIEDGMDYGSTEIEFADVDGDDPPEAPAAD